jgi:hypothetical protein
MQYYINHSVTPALTGQGAARALTGQTGSLSFVDCTLGWGAETAAARGKGGLEPGLVVAPVLAAVALVAGLGAFILVWR